MAKHVRRVCHDTLPWLTAATFAKWLGARISFSLDHNPDRFEIDPHVLAATITNCPFRNRYRWNAVVNVWAFGKWMVHPHLFCMGNGYFRRRSSAESHWLWSDSYLSAETEKSFNMDCCRLSCDAARSCGFVANGLTNR
jgi:hypothetical protein